MTHQSPISASGSRQSSRLQASVRGRGASLEHFISCLLQISDSGSMSLLQDNAFDGINRVKYVPHNKVLCQSEACSLRSIGSTKQHNQPDILHVSLQQ